MLILNQCVVVNIEFIKIFFIYYIKNMEKLNVHTYDMHLNQTIVNYINNMNINFDDNDIENFLNIIIKEKGQNSPAVSGINLIINNSGENYDNINKLDSKKLLNFIISFYYSLDENKEEEKKTIYKIMIEQMEDMFLTGQCSQGRSIRLYQILNFII
jgi:hypothetical protein